MTVSRHTQPVNQTVLRHLRANPSLSPMEAVVVYGIIRLAPAIHDLRAVGYNIVTEMRKDARGHRYARYSLVA